jgi:predicted transcriptional regulator
MAVSLPLYQSSTTEVRVCELLPADLSFCFEDTQVDEAVRLMRDNHLDRLLVLDRDGHVIGTVTLATVTQDRTE